VARRTVAKIFAAVRLSTGSRRAARDFRRATGASFIWFGGVAVAFLVATLAREVAGWQAARVELLLTSLVITPAAIYKWRHRIWIWTDRVTPVFPRPPRSEWAALARTNGQNYVAGSLLMAVLVAPTLPFLLTVAWAVFAPHGMSNFSQGVITAAGGLLALPLTVWSYYTGKKERLAELVSATPPELLRAHKLRDHAQALEDAMHEATVMSDQLQKIIDAERNLIAELLAEAASAKQLSELSAEQIAALSNQLERSQRVSAVRERWIQIAAGVILLFAGYVLGLVDPSRVAGLFK